MSYCEVHNSSWWHCRSCGDEEGPFRPSPVVGEGCFLLCEPCLDAARLGGAA